VDGRGEGGPVVKVDAVTVQLIISRDESQGEEKEADELDSKRGEHGES
jgi:hypothetical protein